MSDLNELQNRFQGYLLEPDPRRMAGRVTDTESAPAPRRLGIYAEAYRLRLLEALSDNFPVLHTMLGDDEFDRMGRAYIQARPPSHFSIRYYGETLQTFLRETAPYADQPVLAEMAAFEWTLRAAFDDADAPVLTIDDMAAVPPETWAGMTLHFHPAVHRLDLEWNAPAVWKAIGADKEPPSPERAEHPVPWVVWRQDLEQYYRSLEVDEAWALDAALTATAFSAICEGLCEWIDTEHAPARAATHLKQWVTDGMISAIET